MKVVIIGGVAGGATAAARLRRLDEQAEIIILERSGYISYANCGLPYYIGGGDHRQGRRSPCKRPQAFGRASALRYGCTTKLRRFTRSGKTLPCVALTMALCMKKRMIS
ncbi:MAG: FAD-dependent oxidoreductase [Acutalibacteraceae bacterium]